jgi:hypothetical protein
MTVVRWYNCKWDICGELMGGEDIYGIRTLQVLGVHDKLEILLDVY